MAYYTNGNLAMKPKRKEQEQVVIRETTKRVIRKKSIPTQEKLLYLFAVVVGAVIATVIIFRYAQIYDINLQIKQMNNEIKAMNIEVENLQREVQTLSNPERIRELAESQGMISSLDNGIVLKKTKELDQTASLD